MSETQVAVEVKGQVTVEDLGGGIYRVDGELVSGSAKMLSAVAGRLGIVPKPRQRKPKEG